MHPADKPSNKMPAPFRSLRRLAGAALVAVLALVGLRAWWGWEVDRQIAREIAAAQTRGEPILPEDFDPVPMPGSQNAVPVYERAMAAVTLTREQRDLLNDFDSDAPLPPAQRAALESILRLNAEALRLAREARGRPLASWDDQKLRPPVFDTAPSMVGYEVGRLLLAAAKLEAEAGDWRAAAAATWHDLAGLAAALRRCNVVSYSDDESTRVVWWVCTLVERAAPVLPVDGGSIGRTPDPDDVRAVVAELLDDDGYRAQQVRTWRAGRSALLDAIPRNLDDWPGRWRTVARALRPALDMEYLRLARRSGAVADAVARAPDVPTLRTLLPPAPKRRMSDARSRLDRIARSRSDVDGMGPREYVTQTYFRDIGNRHLTAVALAAWRYRIDHGGAWPADVGALVPAYLPTLPIDPFAAGGRAVKLSPVNGRHAVYSVGYNGTDEGGSSRRAGGGGAPRGWHKWDGADAVVYLENWRAVLATQPASRPAAPDSDP
jgi:hypothetical protein